MLMQTFTAVLLTIILLVFNTDSFSQLNSVNADSQFQISLIKPHKILKIGEGHYCFDFEKDAFGTLVILLKERQTDTLIIHLGEKANKNHTVDRNPGGTIRYQKVQLSNITANENYIIKLEPNKRNTSPPAVILPDSFGVIMPFRYCELENLTIPLDKIVIQQKVYNYKFNDNASSFNCSDSLLNQIWDLCKYSIKATSFCGMYIDGDRERIPYEADAYINQLSHYCVDNEYTIARRTNQYFINTPTWPTEWILHTVLLFYYDFLYTGDKEPLIKNYEAIKYKTLMDLAREDGLISSKSQKLNGELMQRIGFKDSTQRIRDIVDWPPAQSETSWKLATTEGERDGYEMVEINTVVNSFHYINLKLMAEIAGYLNKKDDSIAFHNRSIRVKEAINSKLFDTNRGVYLDGENSQHASLHANMMPLTFDIVPDENKATIIAFIKSRGMACSVYGSQYLLEGLYHHNEADYALQLITATTDRSWWNMIQSGSTITMEAWDLKYKPNLDWNHAWGAAPANIITRHLWGISPAKPGFAHAHIKPQMSTLTHCSITVPTINGAISAEYKLIDTKYKLYYIKLPLTITADFDLLQDANAQILLNKKNVIPDRGIVKLVSGLNVIEIKN